MRRLGKQTRKRKRMRKKSTYKDEKQDEMQEEWRGTMLREKTAMKKGKGEK